MLPLLFFAIQGQVVKSMINITYAYQLFEAVVIIVN